MSLRTAIDQTGWLPVIVLLVLLWSVVTALNIATAMGAYAGFGSGAVGQTFVGGAAGVLVLFVFAGAVAYVYGELGESDPGPETFPPR